MTIPADVKVMAVVVVRDGQLPTGAAETVAEAGGAALLVGSGIAKAADGLDAADRVWLLEAPFAGPAALATTLAPVLATVDTILLPASPDGRDLAPRLAVILGRPLLAGAVRWAPGEVEVTRLDDRLSVRVGVDGPVLITLLPGRRGTPEPVDGSKRPQVNTLGMAAVPDTGRDAESVEVLQPEPGVVDLAEACRIVGGGAGLVPAGAGGAAVMRLLADVGAALGASAGATRVVTDSVWMSYDRQIGTTVVSVNPELYFVFGISGAVQHVRWLPARRSFVTQRADP